MAWYNTFLNTVQNTVGTTTDIQQTNTNAEAKKATNEETGNSVLDAFSSVFGYAGGLFISEWQADNELERQIKLRDASRITNPTVSSTPINLTDKVKGYLLSDYIIGGAIGLSAFAVLHFIIKKWM